MEFKIAQMTGGKVVEIRDSWGERMAILDPATNEVHPVGVWSRVDAHRLAKRLRRFCPAAPALTLG